MGPMEIVLFVTGYLVIYLVIAYWWYIRRVSRRTRAVREPFFEELDRQLDFGVIANLQDVVRVQRSIADEARVERFERTDIKRVLEAYLLRISRSDRDTQQVRDRIELVKEFIEQEPLTMLPETEQAIAQRLNEDIRDGQQDEALRHFRELVSSMGSRYQALTEQVSRTRMWTQVGTVGGIGGIAVAVATWWVTVSVG